MPTPKNPFQGFVPQENPSQNSEVSWTPEQEARFQQLQSTFQQQQTPQDRFAAQDYRRQVQANPEIAEMPYSTNGYSPIQQKRLGQGAEHPVVDPIDFVAPEIGPLVTGGKAALGGALRGAGSAAIGDMVKGAGSAAIGAGEGIGKAAIGAGESIARLPGRAVDAATNTGLGWLRGLSRDDVQAYMANPSLARSFQSGDRMGQEDILNAAVKKAKSGLDKRVFDPGGIDDQVVGHLDQVQIPNEELGRLREFLNGREVPDDLRQAFSSDSVPGNDVRRAVQTASDQKWLTNQITGKPMGKDPVATAAWSQGRQAIKSYSPEASAGIDSMAETINAQKGLNPGLKNPLAFMKNDGKGLAAVQRASNLLDDPSLVNTANAYRVGRELDSPSDGIIKGIRHATGDVGLAVKGALQPVTNLPGQAISGAANVAKQAVGAGADVARTGLEKFVPSSVAGATAVGAGSNAVDGLRSFIGSGSSSPDVSGWDQAKEQRFRDLENALKSGQ